MLTIGDHIYAGPHNGRYNAGIEYEVQTYAKPRLLATQYEDATRHHRHNAGNNQYCGVCIVICAFATNRKRQQK